MTALGHGVILVLGGASDQTFSESILVNGSILMFYGMRGLFLVDHALTHPTQMRFGILFVQLNNFVDKTSVILQAKFGVVVHLYSYLPWSLKHLLFCVELLEKWVLDDLQHRGTFVGVES
jgi:hypothetical protein